jgi:hypothetical protein
VSYFQENWIIWVSAFCVLAIYSYLLKDNAVYRTMMQVFIGINVGYFVVVQWRDVLLPRWWLPMTDGFRALFGAGEGSPWAALWALAGLLGLLYYFQLSRKYFWVSRIVIGVTIGIGAGLTFRSQLGQNLPQVVDSFKPLAPAAIEAAPRRLFDLPGSTAPPAIDGPLVFMHSGRELHAIETLNGVTLWRARLPGNPVGRPEPEGGAVRVFTEAGDAFRVTLDGTVGPVLDRLAPGLADGFVDVMLPPGRPARIVLGEAAGRVKATFEGRAVWSATGRLLGADQAMVFVADGTTLLVLDGATGEERLRLALPGEPTGAPAIADFVEPAKDRGVVLVPVAPGVRAYALRDGVATEVAAGEALWQAPYPEPVLSVTALEGATIVRGATASQMWEIPSPQDDLQPRDYFDNWVFVITMLTVMTYFFFSFRQGSKLVQGSSRVGRWLLMIGFGAFFGNTVMTRMSYLLDRLMFLIDDWLRPFFQHFLG